MCSSDLAPPRFIRGLRRRIAALADEQVRALARSWSAAKNERLLIALLDALPPSRRAGVLAAALTGVRTRARVWSAPALEVMPTPMRQAEAERMAALPDAGEPFRTDWSSGFDVGARAAAQNLADIAAMGARPVALIEDRKSVV